MNNRARYVTILALGLFLFLAPSFAFAQADLAELDRHFEQARANWGVPGMAVAIVKDGEIVFAKGYGVLEEGTSTPVDEHTLFAIASNTKAFISASIATLVDKGTLRWTDPVRQYLPYFKLYNEYVSNEARLQDVLSHRVGLGTFSGDVIWYKSDFQPEEVIRSSAHLPPAYNFRAGYGYSNLMFITAGEVIHAVSGKTWDQYVKDEFFSPLGMSRTQTSTNALTRLDNVATPHKIMADGTNLPIAWVNWDNMGAAGGIISSVQDMAQWLKLHLSEGVIGTDTLFTPGAQTTMWQPHNSFPVAPATRDIYPGRNFAGYGLGWSTTEYRGRFVPTHSGGYDGMYSRVALVPEEELGVVILTNSMTGIGSSLMYDVIDAFLGDPVRDWAARGQEQNVRGLAQFYDRIDNQKATRVDGTSPDFTYSDYAGIYHSDFYGEIEVAVVGGDLRLIFPRAKALNATLTHWHYDTYEINWDEVHAWFSFGTVQFTSNHRAEIDGMTFNVPNNDIFFEEILLRKVR